MINQVGAKLCKHGRQFCAECHMKESEPSFDPLLRIFELEVALQDCASKLESQVVRNRSLPLSYRACVNRSFALLRNEDPSAQVPIPTVWLCPSCNGENTVIGDKVWSGKNLQCVACKEFHYYSEYTVK
jgi:hypothetical protein